MNCSFCESTMKPGIGITFVRKTGKTLNFCKRKCEKNMIDLGRKPRKVKWITKPKKPKTTKK